MFKSLEKIERKTKGFYLLKNSSLLRNSVRYFGEYGQKEAGLDENIILG